MSHVSSPYITVSVSALPQFQAYSEMVGLSFLRKNSLLKDYWRERVSKAGGKMGGLWGDFQ